MTVYLITLGAAVARYANNEFLIISHETLYFKKIKQYHHTDFGLRLTPRFHFLVNTFKYWKGIAPAYMREICIPIFHGCQTRRSEIAPEEIHFFPDQLSGMLLSQ